MTTQLFYNQYGSTGQPIIILHGLFGSSRNWTTICKTLSEKHVVYCIDQRNHGESPHLPSHTLVDLRLDLVSFIKQHSLNKPILIGHSMGGMAAMSLALNNPELLSKIIISDIAPRSYPPHHDKELAALELDISHFQNRQELNEAMAKIHPNKEIRQFLQMNLKRTNHGYQWKINVPVLKSASFTNNVNFSGSYTGETLFISGGQSAYIQNADHSIIQNYFPNAQIHTIPNAGHWLHYSHQTDFLKLVTEFLST